MKMILSWPHRQIITPSFTPALLADIQKAVLRSIVESEPYFLKASDRTCLIPSQMMQQVIVDFVVEDGDR